MGKYIDMKTDTTVEETVKEERRRVFWRLYALPWIVSVILLILISAGFVWVIVDMSKNNAVRDEELIQRGNTTGRKEFQQEAIDNNCGKWAVDRYGIVEFLWISNVVDRVVWQQTPPVITIITTHIEKAFTESEIEVDIISKSEPEIRYGATLDFESLTKEREYPYSWSDHQLSKKIGINLEENLIKSSSLLVHKTFTEYMSGNNAENAIITFEELKKVLQYRLESMIRQEFDGFETYNKVK